MDNNNYEQEFINNVKQTKQPVSSPRFVPGTTAKASTLPWIISMVFALIVLVESVALVIFAINYGEALDLYGGGNSSESSTTNDSPEAISEGGAFNYDDDYNITAFALTCTNDDGSSYTFTKDGTYQQKNSSSNPVDSGTYTVTNSSAVVLKSPNQPNDRIVYYDGYDIVEGLSFYSCDL